MSETPTAPPASLSFHPVQGGPLDEALAAQRELRRTCPVSTQRYGAAPPARLVVSYADTVAIYRDRRGFSNQHGHALDPDRPQYDDPAMRNVFFMDPPEQVPIRRILMTALNPSVVEAASPHLRTLAEAAAAALPESGEFDAMASWAAVLPARVICHMLGVPEQDHERFHGWTKAKMLAFTKHSHGETIGAQLLETEREFAAYIDDQIRQRRDSGAPATDLIGRMIALRDTDGLRLTHDQIVANTIFLLNAGNQTTANLMSNLLFQLLEKDLYRAVRADRSLVPAAIEESLRLTPPIQYGVRQAVTDVEIGSAQVHAGEMVIISHVSADRDESSWGDDAEVFDLAREHPARHLGFGMGTHACLGAPLARRTVELAFGALLDRYEQLRLAPGFRYEKQAYWTSLGPTSLRVVAGAG